MAAFLLVLVALVLIGSNEAVGYYFSHCEDRELMECLMNQAEEEDAPEEGSVTATGVYEWKGYAVNVTMNIPLQGGSITGSVSNTCEGSVKGTATANGGVSGSMSGVCAPFFVNIPSSATYTGSVNKAAKTVTIQFSGQGGGLSKNDTMTLSW